MGGAGTRFAYPPTPKCDVVNEYHGEKVADPYRWLEDPDAAATKEWVTAQNKVTRAYLDEASGDVKASALGRLKETFTYDKWGIPCRRGDHYYVWMQRGLQNQYILYQLRNGLDTDEADMKVLIDPNSLAEDGTSSVDQMAFSEDGRYVAYGVNEAGSDWATIYVTDTETGERLAEDVLKWAKFFTIAWRHDGSGFYYCRFDAPVLAEGATAGTETAVVRGQRLMFHALRTPQEADELVHAEPDHPKRLFGVVISDDGRYIFRSTAEDCSPVNMVHYADLTLSPPAGGVGAVEWVPLVTTLDASFAYIANDGPRVIFETNLNAPRSRIVTLDLSTQGLTGGPASSLPLEELIPQHPVDVLSSVDAVNGPGGQLVLVYRRDVHDVLSVHSVSTGERLVEIPTPAAGCVSVAARRRDESFLFKFVSFLFPGSIFHVDLPFLLGDKAPVAAAKGGGDGVGGGSAAATPGLRLWREMTVPGFEASSYQTEQVFYASKDGTKIPAFIVRRRPTDGVAPPPEETPCLLYGYGGFMIPIMPYFSTSWLMWLQCFRGVLVIANIRGGSEYGTEWHEGGILTRKQNVFDDFAAAAEYLTTPPTAVTVPGKLAIMGGSNGGLLVGASINQRPGLFGAAVAQVGVHDMLRFASFTIGSAWASDYGDVTNAEHYAALRAYSPLHNVGDPDAGGVPYPATLLTTGDHDDRVCPAHSLKFAAALQAVAGGSATQVASGRPLLIRIDTNAGHGMGKSTEKALEETADTYTFLSRSLGAPFHPPVSS